MGSAVQPAWAAEPCPVCGDLSCVGFDRHATGPLDTRALREEFLMDESIEKVVVGEDVWVENGPDGRRLLYAKGDVISAEEAKAAKVKGDDAEVTHVVAPAAVWSEPDSTGGSTQLVAKGDVIPVEVAREHGIDVRTAEVARRGPKVETTAVDGPAETTAVDGPAETADTQGLTRPGETPERKPAKKAPAKRAAKAKRS